MILQLFYKTRGKNIVVVLCKIVHDILAAGIETETDMAAERFSERSELGKIASGSDVIRFFGLNLIQNQYLSISIDGNYTLSRIKPYPLSR